MRSNYKQLGNYIREVNIRDSNLKVDLLLGVSIQKKFIPSIANTIGTDMSTYKIVKKNQFAYGPVTSRNGDKISIALLEDEQAIISQAYRSFEVTDKNELLPEYLMMWFKRPEFDRYARFMSHGSTREVFDWTEMCETELSIPHIDKQREIVKEYNVLMDRINLNNRLIQKLEETAQAIYKQWFVDFEFPDEKGRPYKSSGGEMEFNEEIEKDIPKGWEVVNLGKYFPIITGKKDVNIATSDGIYPFFTCSRDIYYTDNFSFNSTSILLTGNGEYNVKWYEGRFEAYQRTYVLTPYDTNLIGFLFYSIKHFLRDITNGDRGSVISFITKGMIEDFKIVVDAKAIESMASKFNILNKTIRIHELETVSLLKLKDLLLSKLATINN